MKAPIHNWLVRSTGKSLGAELASEVGGGQSRRTKPLTWGSDAVSRRTMSTELNSQTPCWCLIIVCCVWEAPYTMLELGLGTLRERYREGRTSSKTHPYKRSLTFVLQTVLQTPQSEAEPQTRP